jgi:GMP synthase (glutamine-hydrolysing)
MILVVDFGGQTAHLISRRIKELGVETEMVSPEDAYQKAKKENPKGLIFSGGPSSVYEKQAPTINPKIFSLGIPILGICYGLQLTAYLLGGKVVSGKKEYGPATIKLKVKSEKLKVAKDLPKSFVVWMSHGDEVISLPKGFETIGSTEHVPFAFVEDPKRKIIGLQFHPEVEHTEYGLQILKNFIAICQGGHPEQSEGSRDSSATPQNDIIENIKKTVGKSYVIGAVSGGVDSTVAGILTAKAIGKRFIPIYVDNGLMRKGTSEDVKKIFTQHTNINPIVVDVVGEMLSRLKGITDSEEKRKIIGNFYIEIFEKEMKKLQNSKKDVKFLLQGTIYSDVIESQGTRHAAKIKSHHNVGGLPKNMTLKLLEPLRFFYKDEIKEIGRKLGLPDEFVNKQPFPGPGFAVRIRGEVTKERLEMEKQADAIVLEELKKANILDKVFLSFPVLTDAFSTAVKGDGRHFGEVVALRVVESKNVMTSTWSRIPYGILQKISSRIVNEVPNVSRVVYDITTKPPATMEWE